MKRQRFRLGKRIAILRRAEKTRGAGIAGRESEASANRRAIHGLDRDIDANRALANESAA